MQIFWFSLTVALIILEFMTVNLVSIWAAIGGIAALLTSFITDNITVQITVFVIVTTIALLLTKKIVKKIRGNKEVINLDVKGKIAVVTKKIEPLKNGRVKFEGKDWSAKADEEIEVGTEVEILDIEGVKLIVRKGVK